MSLQVIVIVIVNVIVVYEAKVNTFHKPSQQLATFYMKWSDLGRKWKNLLHKVCFHHFNTYLCGTFSKKSINEEIMQTSLRIGTILKGRYRIEEVIAQGGFGITYLATDMLLKNKIVIKEFFMKGNCNRNNETRNVEISTRGFTKQFTIFKSKFIKEAKTLYNLNFSKKHRTCT